MAPISALVALHRLSNGAASEMIELAKEEYVSRRIRNLSVNEQGATWQNARHPYRATGGAAYLEAAIEGADAYIARRISKLPEGLADLSQDDAWVVGHLEWDKPAARAPLLNFGSSYPAFFPPQGWQEGFPLAAASLRDRRPPWRSPRRVLPLGAHRAARRGRSFDPFRARNHPARRFGGEFRSRSSLLEREGNQSRAPSLIGAFATTASAAVARSSVSTRCRFPRCGTPRNRHLHDDRNCRCESVCSGSSLGGLIHRSPLHRRGRKVVIRSSREMGGESTESAP